MSGRILVQEGSIGVPVFDAKGPLKLDRWLTPRSCSWGEFTVIDEFNCRGDDRVPLYGKGQSKTLLCL